MPKSQFSIFFDDGGVINDNETRGPQWWQLIGDFFIPKYGYSHEQWKEANIKQLNAEIKFFDDLLATNTLFDFTKYLDDADESWIRIMFENLGIPVPNRNDCIDLAREATGWIVPQIKASYNGMNELVMKLSSHFDLYTSSGEHYEMIKGYFKAQGIAQYFKKLYGPDLIGVFKSHPEYFKRIFQDTGVAPENAIIIDDKTKVLDLARSFGANCILSNLTGSNSNNGQYPVFNSPEELLVIISNITGADL